MMLKCNSCERVFDFEDAKTERHYIADYGDERVYQEETMCPYCKGDFSEVFQCEICGDYFYEDEMKYDVCDHCIDSKKYDIDFCYKISLSEDESVDINCFLANMFTPYEINTILWNNLKEKQKSFKILQSEMIKQRLDCTAFIDLDRQWFAEKMVEVKENETK